VTYFQEQAETLSQQGAEGFIQLTPERNHLVQLVKECGDRQDWERISSLAWAVDNFLDRQGHGLDREIVWATALSTARSLNN